MIKFVNSKGVNHSKTLVIILRGNNAFAPLQSHKLNKIYTYTRCYILQMNV